MNLQARAALLDSFLVANDTPGERQGIIVKRENAPKWVTDVVYAVHGNSLPDDWTYKAIKEAASAIEDDGEDAQIEADVYTGELLEWLMNANGAVDYCDEATSEYGAADSIIATIQQGQAYAYAAIVSATLAALTDADIEDEEEEEEEEAHVHVFGPFTQSRFTGAAVRYCACGAVSLDGDDEDGEEEEETA